MFVPSPCQMTINRRNSCASRIITGSVSGSRKRVPTRLRIATWDIGEDKSFADDLNKKQSIVSSRVALLLRSAEIKLLFHRFVQQWTFLPFALCSWGFVSIGLWWVQEVQSSSPAESPRNHLDRWLDQNCWVGWNPWVCLTNTGQILRVCATLAFAEIPTARHHSPEGLCPSIFVSH